jgi:hypothetical protein
MEELIIETGKTVTSARSGASQTGEDSDREMNECLARLKVWQTENLMAPHGMDRFAEKKRRPLKMNPVNITSTNNVD